MPPVDEFLLPPVGDEPTGKTLSALERSRRGHNALLALFGPGMLPSSVMRAARVRADPSRDAAAAARNYADSGSDYKRLLVNDERLPAAVRDMARKLDYRNNGPGALSKLPKDVARSLLLFYTEPGDVMIDPFMGHDTLMMETCLRCGRDFIGCDLSADFMTFNRHRAAELRAEFKNRTIKLYECDSREQPIADGVGDFTLTSPPYWNIEWYGSESEQLGRAETYNDFLAQLKLVIAENFRTLKPGAFSCWFVNDFRRRADGMYFYHMDVKRLGEEVGFVAWDIIVVDLGLGIRDAFPNAAIRTKVIPKRHEYVLVFRKPPFTIDSLETE